MSTITKHSNSSSKKSAVKARVQAATEYLERGWAPVPVQKKAKYPMLPDWLNFQCDKTNAARHFGGVGNLGMILGARSGGLVDVDLDCDETIKLADEILPDTDAVFGRGSKPRSHRLYYAEGAKMTKYQCRDDGMLLELRSTGGQTVFPPSVHPSGEPVSWTDEGEPEKVDAAELARCCRWLAAAALLTRYWPRESGCRNEIAMALAGALLRADWDEDDASWFVYVVADAAGDEEAQKRCDCVAQTARKIAAGKEVTGLPTLVDLLGEVVVERAAEWLSLEGTDDRLILDSGAPLDIARRFLTDNFERDGTRTLHYYRGGWYRWSGKHYLEVEVLVIERELYNYLDGAWKRGKIGPVRFSPARADVERVLHAVKAETLLEQHYTTPCFLDDLEDTSARSLIACKNGQLLIPKRELYEHDPLLFNTNALPFDYKPNAPTPKRWLAFLDSVWDYDPECIDTLQEIFGYLLTHDTRQQKIFLIIGPKRSGKGTIARVLRGLLGHENVAGPTFASLSQNFGLSPLIDKQAAIVSDARMTGRSSTLVERLLSVSGEDMLTVDRKYRDPWTGKLGVRFLILTNELPRMQDSSGALSSRFIVLTLTQSFLGREDPDLTRKLLRGLPGILNWSLDGLDRLRQRGYFAMPTSSDEAIRNLEDLSSPVAAFVRDYCDVGPGKRVDVDDIYEAWRGWCYQQGHDRPGTKANFGKDLHAVVPTIRTRRGTHDRFYEDIGLNTAGRGLTEREECSETRAFRR